MLQTQHMNKAENSGNKGFNIFAKKEGDKGAIKQKKKRNLFHTENLQLEEEDGIPEEF